MHSSHIIVAGSHNIHSVVHSAELTGNYSTMTLGKWQVDGTYSGDMLGGSFQKCSVYSVPWITFGFRTALYKWTTLKHWRHWIWSRLIKLQIETLTVSTVIKINVSCLHTRREFRYTIIHFFYFFLLMLIGSLQPLYFILLVLIGYL